ncbi:MAG: tRNA pseudouridine(55) synthase TruB [bacterium]
MPERIRGIVELSAGRLFLIDKPAGITSHDVVDRVRKLTGEKRVGHSGTLDPAATGLLVVGVGRGATRTLAEKLDGGKRYRATARLGLASDTLDAEGNVFNVAVPTFARERIVQALDTLAQMEMQVPPMVSALKRQGIPLYKLARRGWWIEREPRPVRIDELVLVDTDGRDVTFDVAGGGGLYVRSVVNDLGRTLGAPASLVQLRRTSIDPWRVEDALTLEELETMGREGLL